jgi:hypothetical protein
VTFIVAGSQIFEEDSTGNLVNFPKRRIAQKVLSFVISTIKPFLSFSMCEYTVLMHISNFLTWTGP